MDFQTQQFKKYDEICDKLENYEYLPTTDYYITDLMDEETISHYCKFYNNFHKCLTELNKIKNEFNRLLKERNECKLEIINSQKHLFNQRYFDTSIFKSGLCVKNCDEVSYVITKATKTYLEGYFICGLSVGEVRKFATKPRQIIMISERYRKFD